MFKALGFLVLAALPACAQNYTITTQHMTMHVGDLVPPCVIEVINQTTNASVGEGGSIFNGSGYATCSFGATSSSPVGTYTITVNGGDLSPKSGGTVTVVNGTIDVIAADNDGAKLNDTITYPSGWTSGPAFPMINVTSNPICNMVHDNGGTDNTPCLQNLLTGGGLRAGAGAIVNTSGATVTSDTAPASSNMNFTHIPVGTSIKINGTAYTVASVASSTSLTLTTSAGTQSAVLMSVPTTVNTSGTTVTATNGITFTGLSGPILINGVQYTISSVTNSTQLVTTTTLPSLTGAVFYQGNFNQNGYGRGALNLYFPGGIYSFSGAVQVYDNYWRLIGDGPQKTIFKLAPGAKQFTTGTTPVPFINVATVGTGDNDNFSEFVQNLGIEIAQGNTNAVGIIWPNNNMGAIRNVQIWSEDSSAYAGVYMDINYTGPTLLKDVAIYGFQTGLSANSPDNEYSLTVDELTLEAQTTQGCLCNMTTSIQHLLSDNAVSAMVSTAIGRGALIDSEILSTSPTADGIVIASSSGSQLYFNNVTCTGYTTCENDNGTVRTTLPSQDWTGTAKTIFDSGSTAGALVLADTETPIPSDPAVSTWTELSTDPTTWCTSITGSTSATVYLPPGTYTTSSGSLSCTIPSTINHIIMYDSHFASTAPSSTALLTLTVSGSGSTPLVVDGCMHEACQFNHTGSRTLVLLDMIAGYQAASGTGNVYFENTGIGGYDPYSTTEPGPTFYSSQFVTARQLDIETGGSSEANYKIACTGASLWILGYKTENNSPSLIETDGCQANLFGFWFYNLQTAPAGSAPIELTDSSLFATGFDNWNASGDGSPYWVTETRTGVGSGTLAMPGYTLSYGEALNMFYSYGSPYNP